MLTRFLFCVGVVLLSLYCFRANGQSVVAGQELYNTHRVTVESGLSQSNVISVIRDSDGFVWIGTDDGLNLYDGHTIKIFKFDEKDSSTLSNNSVRVLFEDSKKRIWVGTFTGLNLLDKSTGKFKHFFHNPRDKNTISQNSVLDMAEDKSGRIWIGTYHGLSCYDPDSSVFSHYYFSPDGWGLASNRINAVFVDDKGRVWAGTEEGLSILDTKTKAIRNIFFDNTRPDALPKFRIHDIFQDSKGIMWFATEGNGLSMLLDEEHALFKHYTHDEKDHSSIGNNMVNKIVEDADGSLWVGTDGAGVNILDPERKKFNIIKSRNDITFRTAAVYDILLDGPHRVWIGVYGGGLTLINRNVKKFRHYELFDSAMVKIGKNAVIALVEDQNKDIWIGTGGSGLYRFTPSTQQFKRYAYSPGDPKSLSSNVIKSLCVDDNNNIYAGAYAGGLNYLDTKSGKVTSYQHRSDDSTSISTDHVWALNYDPTGRIWVGLLNGFDEFLPKTKTFRSLKELSRNPSTRNIPSVFVLLEDHQNNLWAGLRDGGLLKFNEKRELVRYYRKGAEGVEGNILDDEIFEIFEDSKNRMWIGSAAHGLWLFDPETEKFSQPYGSHKLPNAILAILEDDFGFLWISSYKGLYRYYPDSGEVLVFDVADGLQGNEFSYGTKLKTTSGQLLFGGLNGLTVFDPLEIKVDTTQVDIVFSELSLFHKEVSIGDESGLLPKGINYLDELVLEASQNVFTIHFAALDYHFPKENQYSYKLDGFDKDWNQIVDNTRSATYTNLPVGRYVFKVKATNHDGVWNLKERTLIIVVKPYWYEAWWFKLLVVLFLIGNVFTIIRVRTNILSKQNEKLEQQVEERTHEIKKQKLEIEKINTTLRNQNEEITRINETVTEQNEELKARNEEIQSQREQIEIKSGQLEEANVKVLQVNSQLIVLNNNLEKLVQERTYELQNTIKRLTETDEGLNTFLYRSSHDLRGPITSLLGLVNLLRKENKQPELTTYFDMVDKTCNHMLRFLKRLNDVSVIFRSEIVRKPVLLADIGNDVWHYLKENDLSNRVRITMKDEVKIPVHLDPTMLVNIITSLLENAIVFSREVNPEASVIFQLKNNSLIIRVSDNGLGIKDDMKARIFELFFRGTELSSGNGLGLYIVKKSTELMNGTVEMESQVDVGTVVTVTIPL